MVLFLEIHEIKIFKKQQKTKTSCYNYIIIIKPNIRPMLRMYNLLESGTPNMNLLLGIL